MVEKLKETNVTKTKQMVEKLKEHIFKNWIKFLGLLQWVILAGKTNPNSIVVKGLILDYY